MGGCISGRGNATFLSEFNFNSDPEAANCVLLETPQPVTLVTWDLTEHSGLSWDEFDALTLTDPKRTGGCFEAKFVADTSAKYAQLMRGTTFGGHHSTTTTTTTSAKLTPTQSSPAGSGGAGSARQLMQYLQNYHRTSATAAAATDATATTTDTKAVDTKQQSTASTAVPVHPHTVTTGFGAVNVNPHLYIPCDAYAVAIWLHPELIASVQLIGGCVETAISTAGHSRGAVCLDWYGHNKSAAANLILPLELHTHRFTELLRRRIALGSKLAIDFEAEAAAEAAKSAQSQNSGGVGGVAVAPTTVVVPAVSITHPIVAHSFPAPLPSTLAPHTGIVASKDQITASSLLNKY